MTPAGARQARKPGGGRYPPGEEGDGRGPAKATRVLFDDKGWEVRAPEGTLTR